MATQLAVPEQSEYAILLADSGALGEILRENVGDGGLSPFELDRVRVPAGGGTTWTVPSLDGDQDIKTLEGIILFQRTVRSYWAGDFSGAGSPPDCSSQDGVAGVGDPGGDCGICPLAQFGSGRNGRSQACKLSKFLFLVRPESVLPMLVAVPPSSLKPVRQYMLRLAGQGVPFYGVVTRLDLAKTKNADGIAYSQVVPSLGRKFGPEETAALRRIHESLRPVLGAVRLDVEDDE